MRKSNKTLVVCVLALVLTLIPNHTSFSAACQQAEEPVVLEFLSRPRAETKAVMEFFGTEDSLPGSLGMFTVSNQSGGFFGGEMASHMLFINNQGQIVKELYAPGLMMGYNDPQMFNETTLMVSNTPMGFLTFWNLETNAQYTIEAINGTLRGHHDWHYNPVTDTFVTLGHKEIEDPIAKNVTIQVDAIWEFNWNGDLLWEWDLSESVDLDAEYVEATQCMVSNHTMGTTRDYSHANGLYWDSNTNIMYINYRHLDNAWAIEYPTGKVLWKAGRNGDFTMYDKHGVEKISLWWHSHVFYPVPGEPNKFILFNNDCDNGTRPIPEAGAGFAFSRPDDAYSRIVEVEIDTETWIMRETWSWAAPADNWSPVWGIAERLPNGNRVGCFGSSGFQENATYGCALIEVDETGDIVWQVAFPQGWGIYRGRRFVPSLSLNSLTDLTCDQGVNDCPGIIWTGKSVFKDYYQITKAGDLLVKDTWTTAKIAYELPSDLAVGTHEYTLTVVDLAGQSVSDTVKVTVEAPMPVFEILPTVGVPIVLSIGFTMVGLTVFLRRKWPWAS